MKTIGCPFCTNEKAELLIEKKIRSFRKEDFEIFEYYYKCSSCKKEFTTTDVDELNVSQVYNLYREKYSIPSSRQLTEIREYYSLSAAKMSEILGFGTNQYRLYETGEIPSPSNGTLLSLIISPKDFKDIILRKKDSLKNSEKILDYLFELIKKENSNEFDLKKILFDATIIPNRFTGFSIPNFEKFANMVLFFINNAPFKTRLNKFLYYADFANYKYNGYSISGCKYAALPMGSVPDNYSMIFGLLETEHYFSTELVNIKGEEHDKFITFRKFDPNLFNKDESNILKDVIKKFKSFSTKKIMEISHNEKGWLDNIESKSIIDYSIYAPQLIAL